MVKLLLYVGTVGTGMGNACRLLILYSIHVMLQNYVIMARLGFSLAKGKVHKSHNER